MNEKAVKYLRSALNNAKGDDLERAEHAFQGLSGIALNQQYGQSGKTCRQILHEYREERALWNEASTLLETLLKEAR